MNSIGGTYRGISASDIWYSFWHSGLHTASGVKRQPISKKWKAETIALFTAVKEIQKQKLEPPPPNPLNSSWMRAYREGA